MLKMCQEICKKMLTKYKQSDIIKMKITKKKGRETYG